MRRVGAALVAVLTGAAVLLASVLIGGTAHAAAPPVVRPGGVVTVTGSGFAPGGAVSLRLVGSRVVRTLHADRRGRVATTYRAPRRIGHYRLVLVGAPPVGRRPSPSPVRGRGDHQVLTVVVPRLVQIPFVVRTPRRGPPRRGSGPTSAPPSGGTESGGTLPVGSQPGDTGHGGGSPAVTGTDLVLLTGLAAVLLVAGSMVVLTVRRRRT